MASNEDTGGVGDTVGYDDLLDLVTESFLDSSTEVAESSGLCITGRLLLISLLELEPFLRDTDEFLALELLELSDGVFVNGVNEEQDFEALLLEDLEEGRVTDSGERFTGEIVDRLLYLGHTRDVV